MLLPPEINRYIQQGVVLHVVGFSLVLYWKDGVMTSHDHNFKNVFLDFPKEAQKLATAGCSEGTGADSTDFVCPR